MISTRPISSEKCADILELSGVSFRSVLDTHDLIRAQNSIIYYIVDSFPTFPVQAIDQKQGRRANKTKFGCLIHMVYIRKRVAFIIFTFSIFLNLFTSLW